MRVSQALRIAIGDMEFKQSDVAAVALAEKLALFIDDGDLDARATGDLSTKLLAVLNSLGMTPAARVALKRGVTTNAVSPDTNTTLASLREFSDARRTRLHAAPDMDAAP